MPRFSKDPHIEQSLRRSVHDGVSHAVSSGAGETYLSAYALLHKASAAQISLLAALPALLGACAQPLSAWLERRLARRQIIGAGVLLEALAWFLALWLPYLYPRQALALVIAAAALYHFGANLITPAWSSLMGDLVPERRRGRFFARRARLMSLTHLIALTAAGLVLHTLEASGATRLGFMLIFGLAGTARLYALHQVAGMHEPARPSAAAAALDLHGWREWLPRLRRSAFARFTLFFALMAFAVAIASPFFAVYMLRDLRFSYAQFTACIAMSVATQFFTLRVWGRLGDVFGNRAVLAATAAVIPLLPALWLVSPNFWYLLAIQVLGGLVWAGFSLAANNYLYDIVPAPRRAAAAAVHYSLHQAAVFAGALTGGLLSAVPPSRLTLFGQPLVWTSSLWAVLLISTLARSLVAFAFLPTLREVRAVRVLGARELFLRVLRFNTLSGLALGVTAAWRRRWRTRPALAGGERTT